jgi:sugar phosphate isomerase/epimerase
MDPSTGRRGFMKGTLLAGVGAALGPGVLGAAPGQDSAPPRHRFKLGCAAYSFRTYLDLKNPKMTLEEFITTCAGWGTDGVELTEYYFKKPVTPEYLTRLKRLAVLSGQPITGSPIGNRFTLPPGDARDAQITSVRKWSDVAADRGAPTVRIFAGGLKESAPGEEMGRECIGAPRSWRRGVISS